MTKEEEPRGGCWAVNAAQEGAAAGWCRTFGRDSGDPEWLVVSGSFW